MQMNRAIVVTGGSLGEWIITKITHQDVLIGCDRGALFLAQHGLRPDLAIGDFDSVTPTELAQIRQMSQNVIQVDPIDKNMTDTELGIDWAITQKIQVITLLGAIGSRLDHTLANIYLLKKILTAGIKCKIIDEHNELMLVNQETTLWKGEYTYLSLLPLSPIVTGVTLEGFEYPLTNATLYQGHTLAISNRFVDLKGLIKVDEGELLIIQSKD